MVLPLRRHLTSCAASLAIAADLSGVWHVKDEAAETQHAIYLFHDVAAGVASVVARVAGWPEFSAYADFRATGASTLVGKAGQRTKADGCEEQYDVVYTVESEALIQVLVTGRSGQCDVAPDFKMTYDLVRTP